MTFQTTGPGVEAACSSDQNTSAPQTPQQFATFMAQEMQALRNDVRAGLRGDRFDQFEFTEDDEEYYDSFFPLTTPEQLDDVDERIRKELGFKDKLVKLHLNFFFLCLTMSL